MSTKELNAFLAWAEENEIVWDRDAIDIRDGKNGLGVFAKRKLEAGYEVIKVPKHAILSVETTAIANILQDEEIEGYIGLTLGCMYEASRGAASPWFAYLSLLAKRPAKMATSLPQNARDMMKSCEAYADIESDITDMRGDFDNIVVPLTKKYPEIFKAPHFDFDAFKAMTAHISSRAMDVDLFHVSALVPFADFINHSSEPNGDYLTHEDVCEVCGSLACEHLGSEDDDDEDSDDESDLDPEEAPALDGSKYKRQRREAKDASEDDDEEEEENDGAMEGEEWEDEGDDEDSDDEDGMINDTCDIILDADVRKGEEITRFYGPYPNKVLLSKYGFAVIDNPHDTVTIQLDMVRQVGEKVLKSKEVVEERIQWFLEVEDEFIGADHGEEGEGGCCGGGDHDHDHGHDHGRHHGHKHGSSDGEDDHEHAGDGSCCGDKDTKKKQKTHSSEDEDEDAEDMEQDEEDEEEDEEEDFPRDIMYLMADGTVDDRLFMLLNVLFMEKATFAKVKEDAEAAGEYMNDIFLRRSKEEQAGDEDEEEEEEEEEEALPPRDKAATKTRRAVLEATQALIRVRADAYGVSTKTSAEKDLEALKKAKLSGPLYYGGICVQGEKQILQNALMVCQHFLSEL
ncbi:hypothetical protein BG006_007532 [Podila minutissima]|uniref:SET domain-containing protein n=1 Tax=Podila minutissima TaxID=64525 RepID=A0A9P5SSB7_9FUNG|nr:hypothetical protein BG006_007532 [Podila minutissima]